MKAATIAIGVSRLSAVRILAVAVLSLALVGCSRKFYSPHPVPDESVVAMIRGGDVGAEAEESATSTGTGWGTLKGQFVLDGDPPVLPGIPVTKDPQVCGNQIPNQTLVVDPASKGIANVLVFARKASRVFKPEDGAAATGQSVFDQKGCIFLSRMLGVRVGEPLLIKNSDPTAHNTSLSPVANPTFNQNLPPNGDATYTFVKQLSLPVEAVCTIHPWMKAFLFARDDPYFAVTDKDGKFEIKNLPAGEEIEFQVWQEKSPSGLNAPPLLSRGRFKQTVEADQTKDLGTLSVPAATFN